MIVDAHTHIFEAGVGGPFNLRCTSDDLLREMDDRGVASAVVLPLAGSAGNDFVHAQCARSAGRLVGLYNPDFTRPAETVGLMRSFFDVHAPKGLKIHPRLQGVTADDPIVRDVLCWASERGVTVLFDVFPHGRSLDDERLGPLAYHRLAQDMPRLKIVLGHAGGYRLHEAFMVAKSNPNIFLDLSFTPVYFKNSSLASDCGFVCRRLPPGRVVYGSDFPHVPFGESLATAESWLDGIDTAARDQIMGAAACRLYAIPSRES
jgi:uncharacterized protein